MRNIFAVPIRDQILIYAPLHNLAALVSPTLALRLRDLLASGEPAGDGPLGELVDLLRDEVTEPAPLQGEFVPSALGLLPTRGCNLACRYCGFIASEETQFVMSLEMARDAVNWYMDQVQRSGAPHAEIHFFGGEPFCVEAVIDLAVHLAQRRAAEIGCTLRFEVATNGTFSEARCYWTADNLDTVVLSFDGPADVQNLHRPYKDGSGSFDAIARNARILSEGANSVYFRACITEATVGRMPEIATWFCQEFRPDAVSFEPLQPTPWSDNAGLVPPDPWAFAHNFIAAAQILEAHGVRPVYAPAEIGARQVTFCPVGKDFVIVAPDGVLTACYLLRGEWEARGLDLRLGRMNTDQNGAVQIDPEAVESIRGFNVHNKLFCAGCFARWHCAGGCHVNHILGSQPGDYDRLCIQARIIALYNILHAMHHDELAHTWLQDHAALARSVWQASDRLADRDGTL
ncbi:MAG: radical SAM protein [Anaerolineae bacterium]|nr:radical SAM protein [Anaerolineae bacterium]